MNNNRFGKIPGPLEVVDIGLDSIAEVAKLPARFGGNILGAGAKVFHDVGAAIDISAKQGDTPPPPGKLVETGLGMVDGVVGGVLSAVGGAFDALKDTGDGLRQQVGRITR